MRPSTGAIEHTRLVTMPIARQKQKVVEVSFDRSIIQSKWAVELLRHQREYLDLNELKLPGTDIVERDTQAITPTVQCGEIH